MAAEYALFIQPPDEPQLIAVVCKIVDGCVIYSKAELLIDHELQFIKSEEC